MRIDLRNTDRERLFTVEVDPASPPTVVRGTVESQGEGDDDQPTGRTQAVSLNWDRAIDDEKHLRRCPACGCEDLYARHQFPRLTAFVMIALAAVVAIAMLGLGQLHYALIVLGLVGLVDVGVYLFFSGKVLICYRCHSEYRDLPIGREARSWRAELDERYRPASG
ncbi:MAG: hypothetical protein R3C45_19735 [Phycisphaerales bacterium]